MSRSLDRYATHTPGPWKFNPFRLSIPTAHGPVEGPIMSYLAGNKATAPGMTVSVASERYADHALCAAAPDLLAALQGVLRVADRATDEFDAARAAIAKATEWTLP